MIPKLSSIELSNTSLITTVKVEKFDPKLYDIQITIDNKPVNAIYLSARETMSAQTIPYDRFDLGNTFFIKAFLFDLTTKKCISVIKREFKINYKKAGVITAKPLSETQSAVISKPATVNKEETHEDTIETQVNLNIGMFFDGTGNNMDNSDSLYYKRLKNGYIKSSDIPVRDRKTKIKVKYTDPFTYVNKIKEVTLDITNAESHWNPYSNVVKLYELYEEKRKSDAKTRTTTYNIKQYIQGIGTEREKKDDLLGSGFGRGERGILARVEEGIRLLVAGKLKNKEIFPEQKINKITFDVFGFSRGAAAARHFCNEVTKDAIYHSEMVTPPRAKGGYNTGRKIKDSEAGGYLGDQLKKAGIKPYGKDFIIEIRFLGLFDTVVGDFITDNYVGLPAILIEPHLAAIPIIQKLAFQQIKTDVKGLGIKKIFHITAHNEFRKNFASTPIDEGQSFEMLGSHSDIGGGYAQLDKDATIVDHFDVKVGNTDALKEKTMVSNFYKEHYYLSNKEVETINTYDHYNKIWKDSEGHTVRYEDGVRPPNYIIPDQVYDPNNPPAFEEKAADHYIIKVTRNVSNKYTLVSLNLMHQMALKNGVPFFKNYADAGSKNVTHVSEHQINDPFLEKYTKILLQGVIEEKKEELKKLIPMHKTILQKYVHLSANYGSFENDYFKLEGGQDHILEDLIYVNQPVKESSANKGSKIIFKRVIL